MADWARDVVNRFHFYLELPDVGEARDLQQARDLLGHCLAGLVLASGRPLPRADDLLLYRKLDTLGPSESSRIGDRVPALATEIQKLSGSNLRAARDWLEGLVRSYPTSSPILVIVGGEHPDFGTLRDLTELVCLAGLG
jgi:hypothetical protein